MSQQMGKVLIYGASGAMGMECVRHFKNAQWLTIGVVCSANQETLAHKRIEVDKNSSIQKQEDAVKKELESILDGSKLDAWITTAGGWKGGKVNKNFSNTVEALVQSNLYPSCVSAAVASKFLKENGLIVFFGASSALVPTPDMVAYGMIKNAIHHLVRSSTECDKCGLGKNVTCVGILPGILDTPDNRKWLKNMDLGTFTPLEFLSKTFEQWVKGIDRPNSGSLLKIVTKDGQSTFESV